MKKLFFAIPVFLFFLASCGGGCNTSTVEGANDCMCNYMIEYTDALKDGDFEKMSEVEAKVEALKEEVDAHVEAGDYTEEELEEAAKELEGECGDL